MLSSGLCRPYWSSSNTKLNWPGRKASASMLNASSIIVGHFVSGNTEVSQRVSKDEFKIAVIRWTTEKRLKLLQENEQ